MDTTGLSAAPDRRRRRTAAVLFVGALATALAARGQGADAAVVATVPMGTAATYSVLGGSTVTNTGSTVVHGSLGLWPGDHVTGFPPGLVVAPGTTDVTTAVAQQAQSDLTAAYDNAAGRPLPTTTAADLTNLVLPGGVYAGPSKGALGLTGPLVLDGQGDASSVFIFQTDSSLITASDSSVTLTNGAQECNVFWQVGSSATLGTHSVFVGNILALTSITVNTGVTVHGRTLARNGAVTMDGDVFTAPSCATAGTTTTTAIGGTGGTDDTTVTTEGTNARNGAGGASGTDDTTSTTATMANARLGAGDGAGAGATTTTVPAASTVATSPAATTSLAKTGRPVGRQALTALAALDLGLFALAARSFALARAQARPR